MVIYSHGMYNNGTYGYGAYTKYGDISLPRHVGSERAGGFVGSQSENLVSGLYPHQWANTIVMQVMLLHSYRRVPRFLL